MKLVGMLKADLGSRRNRPFGTGARNSEAVTQRRKPVFPFLGRQRSGSRHRFAKNARSIPDLHPNTLAFSNPVSISSIGVPASQVPTSGPVTHCGHRSDRIPATGSSACKKVEYDFGRLLSNLTTDSTFTPVETSPADNMGALPDVDACGEGLVMTFFQSTRIH